MIVRRALDEARTPGGNEPSAEPTLENRQLPSCGSNGKIGLPNAHVTIIC
jgi:hypothetical protein